MKIGKTATILLPNLRCVSGQTQLSLQCVTCLVPAGKEQADGYRLYAIAGAKFIAPVREANEAFTLLTRLLTLVCVIVVVEWQSHSRSGRTSSPSYRLLNIPRPRPLCSNSFEKDHVRSRAGTVQIINVLVPLSGISFFCTKLSCSKGLLNLAFCLAFLDL